MAGNVLLFVDMVSSRSLEMSPSDSSGYIVVVTSPSTGTGWFTIGVPFMALDSCDSDQYSY